MIQQLTIATSMLLILSACSDGRERVPHSGGSTKQTNKEQTITATSNRRGAESKEVQREAKATGAKNKTAPADSNVNDLNRTSTTIVSGRPVTEVDMVSTTIDSKIIPAPTALIPNEDLNLTGDLLEELTPFDVAPQNRTGLIYLGPAHGFGQTIELSPNCVTTISDSWLWGGIACAHLAQNTLFQFPTGYAITTSEQSTEFEPTHPWVDINMINNGLGPNIAADSETLCAAVEQGACNYVGTTNIVPNVQVMNSEPIIDTWVTVGYDTITIPEISYDYGSYYCDGSCAVQDGWYVNHNVGYDGLGYHDRITTETSIGPVFPMPHEPFYHTDTGGSFSYGDWQ